MLLLLLGIGSLVLTKHLRWAPRMMLLRHRRLLLLMLLLLVLLLLLLLMLLMLVVVWLWWWQRMRGGLSLLGLCIRCKKTSTGNLG